MDGMEVTLKSVGQGIAKPLQQDLQMDIYKVIQLWLREHQAHSKLVKRSLIFLSFENHFLVVERFK